MKNNPLAQINGRKTLDRIGLFDNAQARSAAIVCAIGLATHELYGHGETRIIRTLDNARVSGDARVDDDARVLAATSLLLRQTAIRGDVLC